MSIFRSVEMIRKKIRIPREHAVEFMDELGKNTEGVEFIDMNKSNQEGKKNFYDQIKLCDDVEKKIANIEKVCENYGKEISRYLNYQSFLHDIEFEERSLKREKKDLFDTIRLEISKDEEKILELENSHQNISENLNYIKEKKAVYDQIAKLILSGSEEMLNYQRQKRGSDDEVGSSGFNTLAGIIKAEDEVKMKRMIFRVSRGRASPSFFELSMSKSTGKDEVEKVTKKIFLIFSPGGQENILMQKLIKVCDIYGASRFNIPKTEEMRSEIVQLNSDISEKEGYLKSSKTLLEDFLREKIGSNAPGDYKESKYDLYKNYIKKQKYLFHELNKCILTDNFIEGEVWVTEENFPKVEEEIKRLSSDLSMTANFSDSYSKNATPPTHIKTNELSWVYQEITNAYGVPRYGEVNPSLYSIITFPFLFGIMFGDIGHGGLLLLFALYLVFKHDEIKKSDSPLKLALKARYILLLMGISAHYMGWMYNDFLSIPINLFGTCYVNVRFLINYLEIRYCSKKRRLCLSLWYGPKMVRCNKRIRIFQFIQNENFCYIWSYSNDVWNFIKRSKFRLFQETS